MARGTSSAAVKTWLPLGLAVLCGIAAVGLVRSLSDTPRLARAAVPPSTAIPSALSFVPTVFFLDGCSACEAARPAIEAVEDEQLPLQHVEVSTPEGSALFADATLAYHVPPALAGKLPLVILGDRALAGPEAVRAKLRDAAVRWKRGEGRNAPPRLGAEGGMSSRAVKKAVKKAVRKDCCTEAIR